MPAAKRTQSTKSRAATDPDGKETQPEKLASGRSIHSRPQEAQSAATVSQYDPSASGDPARAGAAVPPGAPPPPAQAASAAAAAPPAAPPPPGGAAYAGAAAPPAPPPPPVAILDFGLQGFCDPFRTRTAGAAYYLAQVIGDVDRAFDRLAQDFRAGRFDPGGGRVAMDLERLLVTARARADERPEYEQLDAAFADRGLEAIMDALADALDAFETGRAQAFSAPASGARIALQRQIERLIGELTQRGTPALTYAVDALWNRVVDTLVLLQSDPVRRYLGDTANFDPAVTIATLSGAPVADVRARVNRGSAIRQLSANLAAIDIGNWAAVGDAQLIADCAPVAIWPRDARRVPTLRTAEATVVDDAEADRIRIQRRDAAWRTLS